MFWVATYAKIETATASAEQHGDDAIKNMVARFFCMGDKDDGDNEDNGTCDSDLYLVDESIGSRDRVSTIKLPWSTL